MVAGNLLALVDCGTHTGRQRMCCAQESSSPRGELVRDGVGGGSLEDMPQD